MQKKDKLQETPAAAVSWEKKYKIKPDQNDHRETVKERLTEDKQMTVAPAWNTTAQLCNSQPSRTISWFPSLTTTSSPIHPPTHTQKKENKSSPRLAIPYRSKTREPLKERMVGCWIHHYFNGLEHSRAQQNEKVSRKNNNQRSKNQRS